MKAEEEEQQRLAEARRAQQERERLAAAAAAAERSERARASLSQLASGFNTASRTIQIFFLLHSRCFKTKFNNKGNALLPRRHKTAIFQFTADSSQSFLQIHFAVFPSFATTSDPL